MTRPRVGIFAGFWPSERMDNAGSVLVRHRANELQRSAEVTMFVPATVRVSPHALGVDPRVNIVKLDMPDQDSLSWRSLASPTRVVTGQLSPGPGVIGRWKNEIAKHAGCFDAVEVHWSQFFGLVPVLRRVLPETVLVAYAHDVMVQSLTRRSRINRSTKSRLTALVTAAVARRREPSLLNRYDKVATFSHKDAGLLRSLGVGVPIAVEQLYFDLPSAAASLDGKRVLFTGAMFREENDQAARWLLRSIWPLISAKTPEAELVIAGAGPSPELVALAQAYPNVTITGFVEDLSVVYRSAAVVVAPLTTGAGIKLKVIEALASGLPVVATPVAAEGFPEDLFVAVTSEADSFARGVSRLLDNDEERRRMSALGRAWAEQARRQLASDIEDSLHFYCRAMM